MPRPNRNDAPDTWHHVLNRGIAKRTIFETERDCRFFLALLAREVRAGRLELHAYSLMLTHFHLLVRSVNGELSEAMRRVQNRYARYFNRTRRRDGSLFRNRFKSRWVDSLRYRRNVVAYIHDNALSAGVTSRRSAYRWSSAYDWAQGRPPRWLSRDWIASEVLAASGFQSWDEGMDAAFPGSIRDDHRVWVERQLRSRHDDEVDDCSLKHAASPRVVRWTLRKSLLADGIRSWRPVCPAGPVDECLANARSSWGLAARFARAGLEATRSFLAALHAGLLRMLSGLTHREIAWRTGRHRGTVAHDLSDHRRRLKTTPAYARLVADLAHATLSAVTA